MSIFTVPTLIYSALTADETIASMATKVFPEVVDEATLPYLAYSIESEQIRPHKTAGELPRIHALLKVGCFASTLADVMTLADAVTDCLDGQTFQSDTAVIDACTLTAFETHWENDAFVTYLSFRISF